MKKLNYFLEKDSRIKNVYNYAKAKYNRAKLTQHNWEHILRDLYRALVIAETEKEVNYNILILAVLLHDIGATETEYQKHEETGPLIVRRDLPKFGYTKKEIENIVHCVEVHEEKIKQKTIEAKILLDADRLEKCGIGGIFGFYRAQQESRIPLNKWVKMAMGKTQRFIKDGFYTKKAREICGNDFQESLKHFKEVIKNLNKRKDFLISEEDLWSKENQ